MEQLILLRIVIATSVIFLFFRVYYDYPTPLEKFLGVLEKGISKMTLDYKNIMGNILKSKLFFT